MFVPTLRLQASARKIHQNSVNLNRVHPMKFIFDARTSNKYCTHITNTKISSNDKLCNKSAIPQMMSNGDESWPNRYYVDFKNNFSSDSIKYTNESKRSELFHVSKGSADLSNIKNTTNNSNSTLLNDKITKQITKQTTATNSSHILDLLGCKTKLEQRIRDTFRILKAIGIKLTDFGSVILMCTFLIIYVIGLMAFVYCLCSVITQFILEHPELTWYVVFIFIFIIIY
jgi:hypothetical protein